MAEKNNVMADRLAEAQLFADSTTSIEQQVTGLTDSEAPTVSASTQTPLTSNDVLPGLSELGLPSMGPLLVRQASCRADFGTLQLNAIESTIAEAHRKMILDSPQAKLAHRMFILEGLSAEVATAKVIAQVNKTSQTFANQFEQRKKAAFRDGTLAETANTLHGILAFIQDTNKPTN